MGPYKLWHKYEAGRKLQLEFVYVPAINTILPLINIIIPLKTSSNGREIHPQAQINTIVPFQIQFVWSQLRVASRAIQALCYHHYLFLSTFRPGLPQGLFDDETAGDVPVPMNGLISSSTNIITFDVVWWQ
jgi:hypothetical protein